MRVGAILYELLTGRPPSRSHAAGDGAATAGEGGADPRSVNARADRDLSAVALQVLTQRPGAAVRKCCRLGG